MKGKGGEQLLPSKGSMKFHVFCFVFFQPFSRSSHSSLLILEKDLRREYYNKRKAFSIVKVERADRESPSSNHWFYLIQ